MNKFELIRLSILRFSVCVGRSFLVTRLMLVSLAAPVIESPPCVTANIHRWLQWRKLSVDFCITNDINILSKTSLS